ITCAASASRAKSGLKYEWSKLPGPPCSRTTVGRSRIAGPSATSAAPSTSNHRRVPFTSTCMRLQWSWRRCHLNGADSVLGQGGPRHQLGRLFDRENVGVDDEVVVSWRFCLLYTSPSPRD